MVGAGVAVDAALGAGVGFAAKAIPQVTKRTVNETNRVRIVGGNAFKSGRAKNKRFLLKNGKVGAQTMLI